MYLLDVNIKLMEVGGDEPMDASISLPITHENVEQCKTSIDQWLPTIVDFVQSYLQKLEDEEGE